MAILLIGAALGTVLWMGSAILQGGDPRSALSANAGLTLWAVLDAAWTEWQRPPARGRDR